MIPARATITSRRALLTGAAGAIAAFVAQALGRPLPVAGAGNLVLEQDNPTARTTSITTSGDVALIGEATGVNGVGLIGTASHSLGSSGVQGFTHGPESTAVVGVAYATSGGETYGVAGTVHHPDGAGIMGWNEANGLAVAARSGETDAAPPPTLRTAILGIADQDHKGARGVVGRTKRGQGVRGEATKATGTGIGVFGTAASPDGYGVFSKGTLGTNRAIEVKVTGRPPKPKPLVAYVFARSTAQGTQLCVRLPNGKVTVIATE